MILNMKKETIDKIIKDANNSGSDILVCYRYANGSSDRSWISDVYSANSLMLMFESSFKYMMIDIKLEGQDWSSGKYI